MSVAIGAPLRRGEVGDVVCLVHTEEGADLPASGRNLLQHLARCAVAVQVFEAAAFAEPEEGAVLQPHGIAVLVDPRGRRLSKHTSCAPVRSVGQIQVEPRLLAVLDLMNDLRRVRRPADVDNQKLGRRVPAEIDPGRTAAGDAGHPQFHRGIGIAGFRVVGNFECRPIRNVIDDRVLRNRPFIELKERESTRIRTPPIALELSATVDLLLIEPVELSVQQLAVPIRRDRLLTLRGDLDDMQVVASDKSHQSSIRAESRDLLFT